MILSQTIFTSPKTLDFEALLSQPAELPSYFPKLFK
jgi:hypothetical protein